MKQLTIIALVCMLTFSCSNYHVDVEKPYVIEITTFKYKSTVDSNIYWQEDANIEANYTSQQPGFISRESGYADNKDEVIVVVRWESQANADASMTKFMGDESVKEFVDMIDGPSMKMQTYDVK